ncbi:MAG: CBS domain-containing protein [Proteobacteria bacterium]|nr:CBS domain-containing protein [Pseudomonadota bacterium]
MQAKDVMSDGVLSVSADASVLDAARLLVNCRVSAMPVVDQAGIMGGIVSEADLMGDAEDYVTASNGRPTRKVRDVMTRNVITASEDTAIAQIARLMQEHNIKRVPILRKGAVVGIVSRVDILRGLISLSPHRDEVHSAYRRDEQLRREIYAACQGRSWSQAKQVDVVVNGGVAHLWGVAPSDLVRQAYRVAAENVPGVKTVEVHMHIVPPTATRVGL